MIAVLLTEVSDCSNSIERLFLNPWFSGIGTIASILGIIFTIYQVMKNRRTSNLIKEGVENNSATIRLYLDVASLAKMNEVVDLVRENLRTSSFGAACVRLSELKKFLFEYKQNLTGQELKEVSEIITILGSDIIVLTEAKKSADVDKKEMLSHLNRIGDLLSDKCGIMKNEEVLKS